MSNNRFIPTITEDTNTKLNLAEKNDNAAVKKVEKPFSSTAHLLTVEALRIGIVGSGVALTLYPLDLMIHNLHTQPQSSSSSVSSSFASRFIRRRSRSCPDLTFDKAESRASSSNFTRRASFSGFSFAAAGILGQGLIASTKTSLIKNATLSQRSRLLNEKAEVDRKTDDHEQESKVGNNPSVKEIVSVSAIIGIADTTLTQWYSNKKLWFIHHHNEQQQNRSFALPNPVHGRDYFKIGASGYVLRLSRNILLVGGLLTTSKIQEQLTPYLSANQSMWAAATLSGALTGVGSNAIDILYKNQVIRIDAKTLETPSIPQVLKDLIAQNGSKALTRGYGISVVYTVVAYNTVPYMEEIAKVAIPKIENTVEYSTQAVATFFNNPKTSKPSLASTEHQKQQLESSSTLRKGK